MPDRSHNELDAPASSPSTSHTMKVRDILLVACPKCGATEGSLCKRLTPGRYSHIDGVHQARRDAAFTEVGQ